MLWESPQTTGRSKELPCFTDCVGSVVGGIGGQEISVACWSSLTFKDSGSKLLDKIKTISEEILIMHNSQSLRWYVLMKFHSCIFTSNLFWIYCEQDTPLSKSRLWWLRNFSNLD